MIKTEVKEDFLSIKVSRVVFLYQGRKLELRQTIIEAISDLSLQKQNN